MRLFLGIRPPEAVVAHLIEIQDTLRPAIERQGVRFTSQTKMHLTLVFLGDADPVDADGIARERIVGTGPLSLSTGGIGAFPDVTRPKVIWLGVSGSGLGELAKKLETAFHAEDKPFHGHLTLARVSPGSKAVGRALTPFCEAKTEEVSWLATEIDLVLSRPGGEYETLNQYFL